MTGRIGYPNAGRLTTSALLKSSTQGYQAFAEGFFRIPYVSAILADRILTDQTDDLSWNLGDVLSDNIGMSEAYLELMVTVMASVVDTLDLSESLPQPALAWVQEELLLLLDPIIPGVTITMLEGVRTMDEPFLALGGALEDTVSTAVQVSAAWGQVVRDALRVLDGLDPNWRLDLQAIDQVRLAPALFTGFLVTAGDSLTVADTVDALRAIAVMDSLGIAVAPDVAAIYTQSFTDGARFIDSLRNFFGGEAFDGIGLATAVAPLHRMPTEALDAVGIEAVVEPKLVLRVTLTDSTAIDDEQLVQALLSGELIDALEIAAGYLAPNGSFTTWSMNTRTAAVSEYSNYVFNSFARVGNQYLGASDSGLYELSGDSDDGTDIVARIKSGLLQFGGTHLSRLKSAYIATRGAGDFILKIETGDGEIFNYAVSTQSMRSTKVHMGKGQRSRYFSFELVSAGADFDLDTLEFVPIVVQRRV